MGSGDGCSNPTIHAAVVCSLEADDEVDHIQTGKVDDVDVKTRQSTIEKEKLGAIGLKIQSDATTSSASLFTMPRSIPVSPSSESVTLIFIGKFEL